MTILSVTRRPAQATWRATPTGRERVEVYDVVASEEGADPRDIAEARDVPQRWDAHPDERDLLAQDPVVMADPADPKRWVVTVTYRTVRTGRPETQNPDPLSRPTDYEWDDATEIMYPQVDLTPSEAKPILNSAGDPFDPPLGMPVSLPVLRVTRNERRYSPGKAYSYAWAYNLDPFMGVAPGYALMLPWRAQRITENNFTYWRVMREVKFRFEPWGSWKETYVLDAGLRELVYEDEEWKRRNITDSDGMPATTPMLLDGAGRRLKADKPAVYLAFRIYKAAKFAALKL